MINLNGVKMVVIETAANGVVNQDTVFSFTQEDTLISADYVGGKIVKGFLVGKHRGTAVEFTYCQAQADGSLDHGRSRAELQKHGGKIRLIEHFEWGSRPGEKGTNVFEEC